MSARSGPPRTPVSSAPIASTSARLSSKSKTSKLSAMRSGRTGCAVPVVLARLEEDAVAGADDLDRTVLALAEADALGDPDRLPARMGVPGGARPGREMHRCGADRRVCRRCRDGVDVDRA